jgi:hypothetical protein
MITKLPNKLTRPSDFGTEIALGLRSGYAVGRILGRNSDIDTASTPEDLWNGGGLYTGFQPTANENISITSSDVNDTGSDVSTGTATGGSLTTIEDTGATFVTDGVAVGDCVVNTTKSIHGIVKTVTSETVLTVHRMNDTDPISDNINTSGDSYRVVTATSTGGALVKIDPILNSEYELQPTVYITLNGTTTVTTAGVDAFRFSFAQVILSGSSPHNEGDLTATQSATTANVMFVMPAETGQTEAAAYTVPKGQRMLIKNVHISMARALGAAGSAEVYINETPVGDSTRTIRVYEITDGHDVSTDIFGAIVVQEMSDVVVRVTDVSDNNTIVQCSLEYLLVAI